MTLRDRVETRECPVGEKCVKIKGVLRNGGRDIIIRDCYKTTYEDEYGYYRDMDIEYYNDRVDGFMYVCRTNLCNRSGVLNFNYKIQLSCVLILILLVLI